MTHILDALKDNLILFEQKQDSFSDVVPELEKTYHKHSSKIDTRLSTLSKKQENVNSANPRRNEKSLKKTATSNNNVKTSNARLNTNKTNDNNNVNKNLNNGSKRRNQESNKAEAEKISSYINNGPQITHRTR